MLKNYETLKNGIIKQIDPFNSEFHFENTDPDFYIKKYESIKVQSLQNSYLRYGYMLGVLGHTPESVVDIGYGNGDFLRVCSESKISKVAGYDIVHQFELPNHVDLYSDLSDVYEENWEVITFFDSLEHFHELSFLSKLKCKYLYISVPECHYFSDEWFENWKHRRPDEHIYHFNLSGLKTLIEGFGYKLIAHSNIEDIIRKSVDENSNILTCIFEKNGNN